MNETTSPPSSQRTDDAHRLSRAIGTEDALLAAALLGTLDQLGAFFAVKEVASGRYLHVNPAMAELLGRSPEDVVGRFDVDLLEPGAAAAIRSAELAALGSATPTLSEHRIDRDKQRREFSVIRVPLERSDGSPPRHVLAVWRELTAEREREQQLRQALVQLEQQQTTVEVERRATQDLSLRDPVTGLYQQVHFDDQLRREVDLSSREHREFALVAISIDPPTEAVAALGEGARTRVLEALGRLLRSNTRAMDASSRLTEQRFAVLLSGVGLATAHSRMEGLRRQCATQIVVLEGRELGFTVSMGVASFPHTANTDVDLLDAAEVALREAQKRGGNHVALASIRFELGAAPGA